MIDALPDWPLFGLSDDARPALEAARRAGVTAALATIVALDGGGPRPVGTQMVLSTAGLSGFLSGGCLEADVVGHAQSVLRTGEPRRLVYGQGSPWPDIRLLCGARIEVLLERITPDDAAVDQLLRLWHARTPALWVSGGQTRTCRAASDETDTAPGAFRKRFEPTPRMIVLGGDPAALAIAALSAQSGCETTLIRPKGPEAPPPLADVAYRRESPAIALAAVGLDAWTAVAVATHEAELDVEALAVALPSTAFYVGALGARRRLPERRAALLAAGIGPQDIDRLHAPIGLDIGGKAPWDVAVAVLAQITALRVAAAARSPATHLDLAGYYGDSALNAPSRLAASTIEVALSALSP